MKKIFTLFVFAFIATNLVYAQAQMPNASFETWTTGEPNSWGTSDGILVVIGQPDPGTVEQETTPANVYAGTSSVRLTTKHVNTPLGANDIPGVVNLGTITLDFTTFRPTITGYAYTDRPDSIRFAAKYTSGPGGLLDTGNVAVTLTHWTPTGRQVISRTIVSVVDNASFKVFTKKLTYYSMATPDTLLIQAISTSSQTGVLESQMWVDDFSFIGLDTAYKAYINPAANLSVCTGDTVKFRTDHLGTDTYQWYRNNTAIGGAINPGINTVAAGNYYVAVNHNGTVYTTDTITVTVNPLPVVTYTVDAAQDTLCSTASTVALTGGSPANGIYSGAAVTNNHFNPASATTGLNPITYTYTDNNGCVASIAKNILVQVCTGIDVLEIAEQMNIYPNPATSFIVVETSPRLTGGTIEMYDAMGKLVTKEIITATKQTMNLGSFASGFYQVRLLNSNKQTIANAKVSVVH